MLKELLKQMQDFSERISKQVGYRCDVRIEMEDCGLMFTFYSKLNSPNMYYHAEMIGYKDIADDDDYRVADRLIESVSHSFRQSIQTNCRHRWVLGDTAISDPDRVPITERPRMKCGRCEVDYLFWQYQVEQGALT